MERMGIEIGLELPSPYGLGAEWDEVVKQGVIEADSFPRKQKHGSNTGT